jgi:DnaJ-domain-containing protein 1
MDCFALLNEPRRPWLDPDSLRKKFLARSAETHPDRVHNASEGEKSAAQQRYTELNSAYNCLREPKERLQHLLELELGAKPQQVQNIPSDLMNLFMEVGRLCRDTDAFLVEKAATTSPMLQIRVFELGQEWTGKLVILQQQIAGRQETALSELKALDAAWDSTVGPGAARNVALKRLEELYRLFSFFGRWRAQIQERIVRLAL